MHPLHDYVAKQVGDRLKAKRILVWYDARAELAPFLGELRGAQPAVAGHLVPVSVGGTAAQVVEYAGSFFEVRAAVEPLVEGDEPETVLLYVHGLERDRRDRACHRHRAYRPPGSSTAFR